MSTNLDKSLDDIIKAKPRKTVPKKKASGAGVRKASTATTKAQPKKKAPTSKAATKKAPGLTNLDEVAVLADRVILSNIPLDIDEKSIKVGMVWWLCAAVAAAAVESHCFIAYPHLLTMLSGIFFFGNRTYPKRSALF